MSPTALISTDASEAMAAPTANDADVQSNTSAPHPSSSHSGGVQEPESSNTSEPPPYARHTPLDDPFQDGDAPVGYFYPNSNGMQKGLKPATATHIGHPPVPVATPVNPLPLVPITNANPSAVEVVLDDTDPPPPPPPPPPRPSVLRRGLQIPSRVSIITYGFSFPSLLAAQGVTKQQWKMFRRELQAFARMSKTQWLTVVACNMVYSHFLGHIPGSIIGWKMQKHREHDNFNLAYQSGSMKEFEDRWNNAYFHSLGLHVRIEPPGIAQMDGMDVASSKLFKYQQKMGTSSPVPGVASKQGDKKEARYQYKEGRYRLKAAHKGRIIVLPYSSTKPAESGVPRPRMTVSEGHNGQSVGITARAGPSVQDFAYKNQTRSGSDGLSCNSTNAQRLATSHQRQVSSEGLYRGRSEEDAGRAPSPARAPTTRWGGNW